METVFLACFVFGALFTIASVVVGGLSHGAAHVGHGHGHGHAHAAAGHASHSEARGEGLPLLNASSVIGALTWFGAAGYVLTRLGAAVLPVVLLGALLAGAIGWYLVARFLGLLISGSREMDPEDYRLEGTVGRITVAIPAGGTGEVLFSKAGAQRSEAARAAGEASIPRGSEVVITDYAHGFATVQPWHEFLAARDKIAASKDEEA